MTHPGRDEGSTRTTYRALSLGAGVQSSVLALLLSQGARTLRDLGYPSPDIAIFADTGWEPGYVYGTSRLARGGASVSVGPSVCG